MTTKLTTPELPPKYFFRVERSPSRIYPLDVQLRRKRLIGSTFITSMLASNDPKDVHDTFGLITERIKKLEANRHITTDLLGDYPPKTLENQ
jgi:hypothetical protein